MGFLNAHPSRAASSNLSSNGATWAEIWPPTQKRYCLLTSVGNNSRKSVELYFVTQRASYLGFGMVARARPRGFGQAMPVKEHLSQILLDEGQILLDEGHILLDEDTILLDEWGYGPVILPSAVCRQYRNARSEVIFWGPPKARGVIFC